MLVIFFLKDDDDDDEILETLKTEILALCSNRYAVPHMQHTVPKSMDYVQNVLFELDDNRFKAVVRVNKQTFRTLLSIISNNPVFHGKNAEKQLPIWHQLLIVLVKLGSYGENNQKLSGLLGVGDGGTIRKIVERVFSAILSLSAEYIKWMDAAERAEIVTRTDHEFPGAIGYVDGSEIKLYHKPSTNHEAYFSRKSKYAIKIQVICDFNLKVRHLVAGYPGSVHDARIFKECGVALDSNQHFSKGQFLLGDKAYGLTKNLLTPFRPQSNVLNPALRKKFNKRLSKYRIRVEHCFGGLTERFESLKELRVQIDNPETLKFACDWIVVCCILHNIIVDGRLDSLGISEIFTPLPPNSYDTSNLHQSLENCEDGNEMREILTNFFNDNFWIPSNEQSSEEENNN